MNRLDDSYQVGGIGHVAVVEHETPSLFMGILIEVVDSIGVKKGGPALDAVDLVAFFQQQFSEIGSVLAGDAGNEGFFHSVSVLHRCKLLPRDLLRKIIQPQELTDLFQKYVNIIQAFHYLTTDDFLIDLFIIVSQKISETSNACKTASKVSIKNLVLTENIERLSIRLGYPQPFMLDYQLGQHDATI
jgi:hypothetical protein